MKIRFWLRIISPLEIEAIRSLALLDGVEVSLIVPEAMSERRMRMGWRIPNVDGIRLVVGMEEESLPTLFAEKKDIEIFTAPWSYPKVRRAFMEAVRMNLKIALVSEPGDWRGVKGFVRVLRGRMHTAMYKDRLAFVLAIGTLAEEWYRLCRFPADKVYPYVYTTAKPEAEPYRRESSVFQITFIGELVQRKGVDILLKSLGRTTEENWRLRIIGDGTERNQLQRLAEQLGIESSVEFTGSMLNKEAIATMANSDLFVLPSRWDGWGAVVNEALQCGVPVICSNRCGAKRLIKEGFNGFVFDSEDTDDLRRKIEKCFAAPKTGEQRKDILDFSYAISGERVAGYLKEVIEFTLLKRGARPVAPWDMVDIEKNRAVC